MRGTASLLMGTSKAKAICCAMRGDPQLGFRRFILDDSGHYVAAGPRRPASSTPRTRTAGGISASSAHDGQAGDCRQQMRDEDGEVAHATILPTRQRAEILMI